MHPQRKLFHWNEVDETPEKTGIYAWYYRHSLADFDIKKLIADLGALPTTGSRDAMHRVTEFLQTHLFHEFIEEPYHAEISGPLKPTYKGSLHNIPTITAELVGRVVKDPQRLWSLKKVLEHAVPEFASPIYIGMAENLNVRLQVHKGLIERYKAAMGRPVDIGPLTALESSDHSFAREVIRRGFSLNGLVVAVREIDAAENLHLDAENILNRINYPLCGRN